MKSREKESIFNQVVRNTSCNIEVKANDAYDKLPIVVAGQYAEELSKYIDSRGDQVVIPPGWVVSKIPGESIIHYKYKKDTGLIIYQIPKEILKDINWEKEEQVKEIRKLYNQFIWYTEYWRHELIDCIPEIMYEFSIEKASVNKWGGKYVSCYELLQDNITGELKSVKGSYGVPSDLSNIKDELIEATRTIYRIHIADMRFGCAKGENQLSFGYVKGENQFIYRRIGVDDPFFEYEDYAISICDDGAPDELKFSSGYHASFFIK